MNRLVNNLFIAFPLMVFVLDVMFLASGGWASNYGLPLRKILFLYLSVIFVFTYFKNERLKLNVLFYLIFLSMFVFFWGFVFPLNNSISINNSIADGQLFLGLLVVPFIGYYFSRNVIVIDWIKIFHKVLLVLALFHIFVYLIALVNLDEFFRFVSWLKNTLEPGVEDENTSIYMGVVDGKIRIFFGGSIFILILFHTSFLNFIKNGKCFGLLIAVLAILCTYTRSMLMAVAIYIIYYYLLKFFIGRKLNFWKLFLFGLLLILQTLPVLVMADPTMLKEIGLGRDISDDLRYAQAESLKIMFWDNIFSGNGLGASASIVRSETAPWSYELSIFSLYMKIGIIGIIVLFCSFLLLINNYVDIRKEDLSKYAALGALVLAYNFCSNTNPFIFSFAGLIYISYFYINYLIFNKSELIKYNF